MDIYVTRFADRLQDKSPVVMGGSRQPRFEPLAQLFDALGVNAVPLEVGKLLLQTPQLFGYPLLPRADQTNLLVEYLFGQIPVGS